MLKSFALNSVLGLVASVLAFALSCPKAHAHAHHTPNICSATAKDVCAHIGYEDLNTTNAATFMVDLQPSKVNLALIKNVTVDLKMDMGGHSHGSAPVNLTQRDPAHIEVSNAFFPMAGVWTVNVGFDYSGARHQIVIPLEVK